MSCLVLAPVVAGAEEIPCRCRTRDGGYVPVGETACIATVKGPRLARCVMVLNNPSWEISEESCPLTSRLDQARPDRLACLAPPRSGAR